jgi:hypothetical protein
VVSIEVSSGDGVAGGGVGLGAIGIGPLSGSNNSFDMRSFGVRPGHALIPGAASSLRRRRRLFSRFQRIISCRTMRAKS